MFTDAFSGQQQLVQCDVKRGVQLACALLARGSVGISDMRRNLDRSVAPLPTPRHFGGHRCASSVQSNCGIEVWIIHLECTKVLNIRSNVTSEVTIQLCSWRAHTIQYRRSMHFVQALTINISQTLQFCKLYFSARFHQTSAHISTSQVFSESGVRVSPVFYGRHFRSRSSLLSLKCNVSRAPSFSKTVPYSCVIDVTDPYFADPSRRNQVCPWDCRAT